MKKICALMVLWMVSFSLQAITTINSVDLDGTTLQGFNITYNGTMYDVIMEQVTIDGSDPGDSRDIFLGNATGAEEVATAMAAALVPTPAITVGSSGAQFFAIIYEYNPNMPCDGSCGWRAVNDNIFLPGSWSALDQGIELGDGVDGMGQAAKFTQASAVPVPPAVFLFGSGMLALAGVARRRKGGTRDA